MFARTKSHGFKAATAIMVGIIASFIMSGVAGALQNTQSYNVMGVTMPFWFYLVLAGIAVLFIVGAGQALAAIYAFYRESGAGDDSLDPEPIRPNQAVTFDDEADAESEVYDPQKALR